MSSIAITALELRAIESVLDTRNGNVLDFSDSAFIRFFHEHGVEIESDRYAAEGRSKAKRLRCFLGTTPPPLTGKVLAELLHHRLVSKAERPRPVDLDSFRKAIVRLGGKLPREASDSGVASQEKSEADLLRRVFRRETFQKLPFDEDTIDALVDRMDEARRCLDAHAHLAVVILAGSVLEGLCLNFGHRHHERVKNAYAARYERAAPDFYAWKVREWVEVLVSLRDLSPEVEKFAFSLRDFRGHIHPEQLALRELPDARQARIAFHTVVVAADDMVRSLSLTPAPRGAEPDPDEGEGPVTSPGAGKTTPVPETKPEAAPAAAPEVAAQAAPAPAAEPARAASPAPAPEPEPAAAAAPAAAPAAAHPSDPPPATPPDPSIANVPSVIIADVDDGGDAPAPSGAPAE